MVKEIKTACIGIILNTHVIVCTGLYIKTGKNIVVTLHVDHAQYM